MMELAREYIRSARTQEYRTYWQSHVKWFEDVGISFDQWLDPPADYQHMAQKEDYDQDEISLQRVEVHTDIEHNLYFDI